jgi:hypothetical protein
MCTPPATVTVIYEQLFIWLQTVYTPRLSGIVSTIRIVTMFAILDLLITCCIKRTGKSTVHLHTKIGVSSTNPSLVTIFHLRGKRNFISLHITVRFIKTRLTVVITDFRELRETELVEGWVIILRLNCHDTLHKDWSNRLINDIGCMVISKA